MSHPNEPDTTRVSVVVPFFNRYDLLRLTLESICSQTFQNWEAVLVDDGSSDGSRDVALEFVARDPRFRYVQQENGGCARARNNGFAHTDPSVEYVTFLDSDDLWAPQTLQTFVDALDTHRSVDIVYTPWHEIHLINEHGQPMPQPVIQSVDHVTLMSQVFKKPLTSEACDNDPLPYMSAMNLFYSPGAVLLRRAILPAVPFRQDLRNSEDWDLWIRLCVTHSIRSVPGTLFYYRKHEGAKSNNQARMALHRQMIYAGFAQDESVPAAARSTIAKGQAAYFKADAVQYSYMLRDALKAGRIRDAAVFAVRCAKRFRRAAQVSRALASGDSRGQSASSMAGKN